MPINLGDKNTLHTGLVTGPKTDSIHTTVQSSGAYISLYVRDIIGTLDVNIYTYGKPGEEKQIDSFPQISSTTSELILRKQVEVVDKLRIEYIVSNSADFDIRIKGVEAGLSSVRIQASALWQVSNETVSTSRKVLVPSALDDRTGMLIRNANFDSNDVLKIAETEQKLIDDIYVSVLPGESIQPDIQAGSEIWAVSSTGNSIRVEIIEIN